MWKLTNITEKKFKDILVSAIVKQLANVNINDIKDSTRLGEDLGADSVDLFTIWINIESDLNKYGIDLSQHKYDNDLVKIKTFNELFEYTYERATFSLLN